MTAVFNFTHPPVLYALLLIFSASSHSSYQTFHCWFPRLFRPLPLYMEYDLPLPLHLANVYCTVRLCVFCRWSGILAGLVYCVCFADGPANDCCMCVFCRRPGVLGGHGREGVCELRLHLHPAVATGRHGPLPV